LAWDIPVYEQVFPRLASFSRLIRFDPRGSGLSDPLGWSEPPSLEEQAKDLVVVLDAAGCERAAMVGNGVSGLLAIFSPLPIRAAPPRSSLTVATPGSRKLRITRGGSPARP
jgi:hypothetical protein